LKVKKLTVGSISGCRHEKEIAGGEVKKAGAVGYDSAMNSVPFFAKLFSIGIVTYFISVIQKIWSHFLVRVCFILAIFSVENLAVAVILHDCFFKSINISFNDSSCQNAATNIILLFIYLVICDIFRKLSFLAVSSGAIRHCYY